MNYHFEGLFPGDRMNAEITALKIKSRAGGTSFQECFDHDNLFGIFRIANYGNGTIIRLLFSSDKEFSFGTLYGCKFSWGDPALTPEKAEIVFEEPEEQVCTVEAVKWNIKNLTTNKIFGENIE